MCFHEKPKWRWRKKKLIIEPGEIKANETLNSFSNKNKQGDVFSDAKKEITNGMFYEKYLNANKVWGGLITKLRNLNLITLYTACGEIRNVKFNENNLVVFVGQEYLFKILNKDDNVNKIEEILRCDFAKINVEFVKDFEKKDFAKKNLEKLSNFFGENLDLKD